MSVLLIIIAFLYTYIAHGHATICYSCSAVFGHSTSNPWPSGPCWDSFFDPAKVDTVECPGPCIYHFSKTPLGDVQGVMRGCLSREGTCSTPGVMGYACCSEDYCNVNGFEKLKVAKIVAVAKAAETARSAEFAKMLSEFRRPESREFPVHVVLHVFVAAVIAGLTWFVCTRFLVWMMESDD